MLTLELQYYNNDGASAPLGNISHKLWKSDKLCDNNIGRLCVSLETYFTASQ
jgi:hypothetical protein